MAEAQENTTSQAFYRKWRPQSWDAVIGQEHVVQTLRNALAAGRIAHAYLFAGPRGTGKTTTARLLAKAVNCLHQDRAARPCGECEPCKAVNAGRYLDLIEIDAASNTSVEDVRDLREKISFKPNQGEHKVYIIDEVHMLSVAAFNALLKTLEEPPPHALFILATTEVQKIPATVLSRCQRHEFRRIPVIEIVRYLGKMAKQEDIEVEDEALSMIARQSTGAMRDAISLLDQLASANQKITLKMAQEVLGTATSQSVLGLVDAVIRKDSAAGLDQIHQALDQGTDPRQFARQVVDYLRDLLLLKMGNGEQVDATLEMRNKMAQHANTFDLRRLSDLIRTFNAAAVDARAAWQPSLPLEMAFVDALEPKAEPAAPGPASTSTRADPPSRQTPAHPAVTRAEPPQSAPPPSQVEPLDPQPASQNQTADSDLQERISSNWKQIMQKLREVNLGQIQALINSTKVRGVRDGVFLLGFASEILRARMEKPENLEPLAAALSQVLGEEIPVRCFVTSAKGATLPAHVDSDGMVATAVNDLGGEIVDVQ